MVYKCATQQKPHGFDMPGTKKSSLYREDFVRKRRFELPRQLRRYHLKVVRLPISPPPHLWECKCIGLVEMLEYWPFEIFGLQIEEL